MKYILYTFWGLVGICLILVGIANRDIVTVRAMPEMIASPFGISPDIELPLFMVIFAGVGLGLLIGFLWEWVREHRIRAESRAKSREVAELQRQIDRMTDEKHKGKDDIIALLDKAG